MTKIIFRCLVITLLLPLFACSAPPANASFQAGREYQVIQNNLGVTTPASSKIKVIEFFSFGCPWCFHVEPDLEAWLKHVPKDVEFDRVPVVFETGWDSLAKLYYTAKGLQVSEPLILPIFKAIQEQDQNLTDVNLAKQFFVQHGVSAQDFDSAYNFSPGIDAQLQRGDALMKSYGVYAVPSFVVNGKYVTNMSMANGDTKRLLKIVDYLVNKERVEAAKLGQ